MSFVSFLFNLKLGSTNPKSSNLSKVIFKCSVINTCYSAVREEGSRLMAWSSNNLEVKLIFLLFEIGLVLMESIMYMEDRMMLCFFPGKKYCLCYWSCIINIFTFCYTYSKRFYQ